MIKITSKLKATIKRDIKIFKFKPTDVNKVIIINKYRRLNKMILKKTAFTLSECSTKSIKFNFDFPKYRLPFCVKSFNIARFHYRTRMC